jgi:predicted Rossmann-fold nucleotide-binding protein
MAKKSELDILTPQESAEILRVASDLGEALVMAEKKLIIPHIKNPSFFIFGAEEGSGYFRTEGNINAIRKLAAKGEVDEISVLFGGALVGMMQLAAGALGEKEALSTCLNALLAYCENSNSEFTETTVAKEIENYLENT